MNNQTQTEKTCYFCENGIKDVDYKDIRTLRQFINTYKKIFPRKKSGVCSKHQRKLANAIKNARIISLLPYIR
ncbi:MAG: 30S ribosomal protein S18 [Candidatus Falkowbacteria bacterium GW2011_GWC2_38_22]|uniref:Small ribosomal subunit protein bS18 n=1 Tax=Candidatus Falkowbacteria bacterium GW2011_GWE1_38_31 TaxID=1618638 RepID=A0A0G0MZH6_9BACT|nr:MAG: 30S ribosomal protein S18 [Candidatus Falkowbacteria bacterium GW2011_GWF2_38_1205]KKQ60989.1 MAG: 30S ribosomal protein S18 [Candidatus Falkowbacteria bacterium GW2011_GWC2_38_22]KKQ63482.1 MAG: 30S ribosomal protein S18 [Candidatus Falkowbacteria bacterium GW2011_GWF1_38_22]KKQ65447.1 MAG: 30S ribosomal protein S18 [Candidatus Falkowbacteria bacterium GW2011_GWE2_38_254]KKQ70246.1 MAG: 30S ribosomal protein S18 [Candidatus Falkowbacteria bacterium GW2011_GWE1_38_31]KKQ72578.1 MAG: 30